MDMFPEVKEKDYKVLDLVRQREIQDLVTYKISKRLHVTDSLISRLGLEKELNGHSGCVNCLEWNKSGQILASASDDINIILWDPFRYEKKLVLQSGHFGNIFSVKFMPNSNDTTLVSGAGDCRIKVYDTVYSRAMTTCSCHTHRVKRIATAESIPFLFWSAAEDGLIMQYDMRVQHKCKSSDFRNVLINLNYHMGIHAEAKCVAVNPTRPELIAVGANDAYIRMYDRRMIKLSLHPGIPQTDSENVNCVRWGEGDPENNTPQGCAQYFIAGHLHSRQRESYRNFTATYLTFSADGNDLLVNMGGEQIYLFDINSQRGSRLVYNRPARKSSESTCKGHELDKHETEENNVCNSYDITAKNIKVLPPHIEKLQRQGNEGFQKEKYSLAINFYNQAISSCPTAAVLFANRAAAYMRRAWDGDIYAALRDCETTLLLDPEHVKAHFRLARCLLDLYRSSEADKAIKDFQRKFPEYATNSSYRALKMDITEAIESGRDNSQNNQSPLISAYEKEWRQHAIDYKMRYCGHCNTTTDIKEANFFGNNGQYIVAGSDDGSLFIWDRYTTNIVRVLRGDERIVNCLQPHPSICLLATSGIEAVIRLWSPLPEDGTVNDREILYLDDVASANQIRMNSDPFDLMLMNMGYRFPVQHAELNEDGDEQQDAPLLQPLNCRPS